METDTEAIKEELRRFVTLPGEKIVLIKRKHVFNLLLPIILTGVIGAIFTALLAFLFLILLPIFTVFLASLGFVLITTFFLIGKNIVEWNFHWYVITDKKILEVCYIPLITYYINEVLLDQVKCTEVDIRADGLLNELLDMGDINIAFDRPTHHEGFLIHNVRSARRLGFFLSNFLLEQSSPSMRSSPNKQLSWSKNPISHKWSYREEVFPKPSS